MPRHTSAALMLACAAMAACAAEPSSPETRVLVKLIEPLDDSQAIVQRASDIAGVPARYIAAASAQWHTLALACGDTRQCEAALQRLRAASTVYDSVQRDERRHAQSPS